MNQAVLAKLKEIADQRDELDRDLANPDIVTDHRKVRDLSIKKSALDPVADAYRRAIKLRDEAAQLRAAITSNADPDFAALAKEELPGVEAESESLITQAVRSLVSADDRAVGSVVLEIRPGAGGEEASLWAGDILEMYRKLASIRGWKFEPMELTTETSAGSTGIRAAVISVTGEGVWTDLAMEAGTHCVKRVPATEAAGRVHTSTATVAVLPEPKEVDITIDPADVDEHVTTAQGPGGQNVNKVATAVKLLHRPTGIEVRMQETKSQQQNREKAYRLLRARLYELKLAEQRAAESAARLAQIGSGDRSERIRTYRYKDNIAVDHRLEQSFDLHGVLSASKPLEELLKALQDHETARRVAAL